MHEQAHFKHTYAGRQGTLHTIAMPSSGRKRYPLVRSRAVYACLLASTARTNFSPRLRGWLSPSSASSPQGFPLLDTQRQTLVAQGKDSRSPGVIHDDAKSLAGTAVLCSVPD